MQKISCAICGSGAKYKILYNATFNPEDITPDTYTSRRIPDRVHFRFVRCLECGLTFSNPIHDSSKIVESYKESYNPTEEDLKNSGRVYAMYLKSILSKLKSRNRILDIGCGDGFFLKEAKKLRFKELYGVEPSKDAVRKLVAGLDKKKIIADIFNKKQFKKDFFDVVTFFQVFDHVLDPNKFLEDCKFVLKPGGYVIAIMHDAHSRQAKIMGEKLPIFDIQHIYLFDKKTIRMIFENHGFEVEKVISSVTIYSLGYWFKMAPIPKFIKNFVIRHEHWPLFKVAIPMKVGNMIVIARKI